MTAQTCPRRLEELGPWERKENLDSWREDDTCSFCGSLNPATFMARLAAGTEELVPTDKNYKVYVRNRGGESFKQEQTWETREIEETKFYFAHLSEDERRAFVEMLNGKKLALAYPGHFYRLPFFCVREAKV